MNNLDTCIWIIKITKIGNKTFMIFMYIISLNRMYDALKFGISQGNLKLILGYPKFVRDRPFLHSSYLFTYILKDILKSAK